MKRIRNGLTTEQFIEKAKEIHNNKYDYSLVEYINNKTKIKIICPKHGIFEQKPKNHLSGYNCIKCGYKFTTKEKFIEQAKKIHGNKYDYSKIEYKNISNKIKIICPIHGEFEQIPSIHILKKSGCPKCYGNKKLTNSEIIESFSKIHHDKYDYSLVKYINSKTKIKIICPIHGEFEQTPDSHKSHGCSKCSKIYSEDFIKKSIDIHKNKYDYSLINYISVKTKVKIICKKHGIFEQTPNNHLSGKGCPRCNESKGELIIHNFLKENKIEYITQKTFDNCKYINLLRFDFYIEKYNLCIEYDGEQHFKIWPKIEKNNKNLKLRILKDNIKTKYCANNNINLLRIKYNDNIIEKLITLI
jgi:very-short-patch-repair endonuclease/Zn ribbon nucleic-acid-binding protein